jgi:hypothetical protein
MMDLLFFVVGRLMNNEQMNEHMSGGRLVGYLMMKRRKVELEEVHWERLI